MNTKLHAVTDSVAPAQVKAFTQSHGTPAKTDRIDAELIAPLLAFRPDPERGLAVEKAADFRIVRLP